MAKMYVIRSKSGYLLELRQERFRREYEAGREHPWDVCAVARNVEEMRRMIGRHWPDIDYSAVEERAE